MALYRPNLSRAQLDYLRSLLMDSMQTNGPSCATFDDICCIYAELTKRNPVKVGASTYYRPNLSAANRDYIMVTLKDKADTLQLDSPTFDVLYGLYSRLRDCKPVR